MMSNKLVSPKNLFVCLACGKTSEDKYGIEGKHSYGWDVSCMMNSQEIEKDRLVFEAGRVIKIKDLTVFEGGVGVDTPRAEP